MNGKRVTATAILSWRTPHVFWDGFDEAKWTQQSFIPREIGNMSTDAPNAKTLSRLTRSRIRLSQPASLHVLSATIPGRSTLRLFRKSLVCRKGAHSRLVRLPVVAVACSCSSDHCAIRYSDFTFL